MGLPESDRKSKAVATSAFQGRTVNGERITLAPRTRGARVAVAGEQPPWDSEG